ncbi:MAG: hypothetical protein FD183_824 [Chitinophagaceae bacterium]|nr:MAG: hypothetical protein FD183_824 [Chitinophagaceae bacterium]
MVLDSIVNIKKYSSLHPRFANAIEFIQTTYFPTLEQGEIKVEGEDIRAIIIEDALVPSAVSTDAFECHNTYIDIQIIVRGEETVGWKTRSTCVSPKEAYNAEKDVLFFNDTPDTFFKLREGQFAIYFPDDVHAPMIGEGDIKKVVMKIRF